MRRRLIIMSVLLSAALAASTATAALREVRSAPAATAPAAAAPVTTMSSDPAPVALDASQPVDSEWDTRLSASVWLDGGGIGMARFGEPASAVFAWLTSRHGAPDDDSGWRPTTTVFQGCPGTVVRRVQWGEFTAWFSDGPTAYVSRPRQHLFAYSVERDGEPLGGLSPATRENVGVGQTLGDLRQTYGSRVRVTPETGGRVAFRLDRPADEGAVITGLATGPDDTGAITMIGAGQSCES